MWRSLIILQGVLPGKGNKSDRGTGGAADEARTERTWPLGCLGGAGALSWQVLRIPNGRS